MDLNQTGGAITQLTWRRLQIGGVNFIRALLPRSVLFMTAIMMVSPTAIRLRNLITITITTPSGDKSGFC